MGYRYRAGRPDPDGPFSLGRVSGILTGRQEGGLRIRGFNRAGMGYRYRAGRSDPDGPSRLGQFNGVLTERQGRVAELHVVQIRPLGELEWLTDPISSP